jgi:hypothetical protein
MGMIDSASIHGCGRAVSSGFDADEFFVMSREAKRRICFNLYRKISD